MCWATGRAAGADGTRDYQDQYATANQVGVLILAIPRLVSLALPGCRSQSTGIRVIRVP
jgi:hypothetical protein